MADKPIRDYTTIGSIKEFVTEDIAPNYFPDIDDVSKLNVGLLGMIVDINSTCMFDTMQVTSRYITETIPGKSQLPEFIYANANNQGITDLFSKCSSCDAMLMVKESDIINYGTPVGTYIDYYISSDSVVYIDDVPFSLPYDIRIRSKLINGVYNHYCTYDQSRRNSIVKLTSPFVRCVKTHIVEESEVYLALTVKLYQYIKIYQNENIVTNNTLNIPFYEISYTDQMCNFEVYYKSPTDTEYTQLEKFLETTPASVDPFVYYKKIDEDMYRLSFANDDRYFVPDYNSELEIVTFQTLGKKGVFKVYDGDNIYVSSDDPHVPLHCTMVTDAIGGDDAYTLEEIRRMTWERQLTINSYTTDYDLNTFFTLNYTTYDTKALFIKIRDDFATRIFACYTRLKNQNNIFPTNTLHADISLDRIDTRYHSQDKYIVDAGARFVYADDTTRTNAIIIADDAPAPADGIEYTNIAMMSIMTNPNTVAFYMNSIDKKLLMEYTYLNDEALFQFIVKTLTVKRNAVIGEKAYTFTMTILPSDLTLVDEVFDSSSTAAADSNEIIREFEEPEEPEKIKFEADKLACYIFIPFVNGGGHYVKMTYNEELSAGVGYTFQGTIETDDMISESKIQLINLGFAGPDEDISGYCSIDMQDPNIEFLVFYNEGSEGTTHKYADYLTDVDTYTLCNVYKAAEGEMYFAYPMSMIDSTVVFTEIDLSGYMEFVPGMEYQELDCVYVMNDDEKIPYSCQIAGIYDSITTDGWKEVPRYSFFVKHIPLIGREFLMDETNMNEALARLNDHYAFLQQVMFDITANFSIALRFFNTYGRSSIFTISNGRGNYETLNRTHCDIWLSIQFTANTNVIDILPDVKHTIKVFIESISETDNRTGINKISMSSLLKKLHDTYPNEIDHIIFNSINGYDSSYQHIVMNYDLTANENNKMIPEFLTLALEDIRITVLDTDI